MKIRKLLWLLPLSLALAGCKKATTKTNKPSKTEDKTDTTTTKANVLATKVIYDLNDGSGDTIIDMVEDGDMVFRPEDPVRTGLTFDGWYFSGSRFDFSKPLPYCGTITLFANWKCNKYEVNVSNSNNPDAGTVSGAGTYSFSDRVTISATYEEGYTWMYWSDEEGNEVSDSAEYTFVMPANDVTYYGNWDVFTLTTSKNIDGGTIPVYDEQPISAGTEVTLEAETKPGYTWEGWYKKGTNDLVTYTLKLTFTMGKKRFRL